MSLPNDPLFNLQWFLKNTGQAGGTPGIDINVETAWLDYSGTGIRIGIYDDASKPHIRTLLRATMQPSSRSSELLVTMATLSKPATTMVRPSPA